MLDIPAETEQLIRLVAAKSGRAPQDVVRAAVESHALAAGVIVDRPAKPVDRARVDAITRHCASLPIRDHRDANEILDEAWGDPE